MRAALLASSALVAASALVVASALPAFAQATSGGAGNSNLSNGGVSSANGAGSDGGVPPLASGGGGGGGAGTVGGHGGTDFTATVAGGGNGLAPGEAGSSGGTGNSTHSGGGGGGGAHGGLVTTDTTNSSSITGGDGGRGGTSNASSGTHSGGGGGAGGYGEVVDGSGLTYTNNAAIGGGKGGNGGNANSGTSTLGGNGGDGGFGVYFTGDGVLNNNSTITGGAGGTGGNALASTTSGAGGNGGNGGAGIVFNGPSTLNNSGSITGGVGGIQGGSVLGSGAPGSDGAGVIGSDLTIINSGSISGGGTANAITFTGGANTLTLQSGWSLSGNIDVTGSLSFNQSIAANLTNVITGTGSISHDGPGTLTLSGVNTYSGGTTISAGTLVANHNDGTGTVPGTGRIDALGAGAVTLDGGALRTGVSGWLATDVTFNANKTSTISAASGTTLTIGGDPGVPGDTSTSSTGNLPARVILGANSVAQFGSATDTGTIQIAMSSTISAFDIDQTSRIVVAGGTLRDLQTSLWFLTGVASSVTVNAGATLDLNDANTQIINNLGGSGNVIIGTNSASLLQLAITPGTTQTFGGVISGAGGVIVAAIGGTGTMIFTGDNTYTGGTDVCDCTTLQLGNGGTTGSIIGNVVLGGTLAFNRSNTYIFDGVIADDPFAFAGGQVKQIGTGKTILTATSTYTGNTTVDAGTLSVNGDIRTSNSVIVNSGGTLGGTGFVPETLIKAGGTLAPGNSVGTLNVIGNLQFITGSAYAVEVSSAGADRVNVTGNATLGGAHVSASVAAGTTVNRQYTILNAASLTGRFNSSVSTNLSNFVSTLSYDTNNVYLNFALSYSPGSFGGFDQNQQNVANTLTNYFNSTGGIPVAFGMLSPGGLTQVSGEPGADVPQAGFVAMYQFINTMMDNAGGGGNQGGPLGFADENAYAPNNYASKRKLSAQQTDAYAAVTPRDRMGLPFAARWNVWAAGYGGNSSVSGDTAAGSHNTSARVYGTAVGADYRATPDTRFGFALGGAGTSFNVDSGLGGGRADVFQAGAYARHQMGAAYLSGAVAYGWQDVTTDRTVTVSGADKLHASFNASTLAARLETGWRYAMPAVAVTPYAAAQTTTFYLPGYAENATSGSGTFALNYASQTVTASRGELGARFDKAMPLQDALLTLRARTAWVHDWNTSRAASATFQTLPGATFVVNGAQPAANAVLISAGTDLAWGDGWTVAANFDGEFSSTTRSYAGRGSLRHAW